MAVGPSLEIVQTIMLARDQVLALLRVTPPEQEPHLQLIGLGIAWEDKEDPVERLLAWSEHLVVTHTCIDQLKAITDRAPDVVIEFRIDEQSIDYLQQRLREARRRSPEPALLSNGHYSEAQSG